MNRFVQFVVTLAVLFAATSANAATVLHRSETYTFSYWIQCANNNRGELVNFSGYFAEIAVINRLEEGGLNVNLHQTPFIVGIGQTTARSYTVLGSSNTIDHVDPGFFSGTVNSISNFGVTGGGISLQFHEQDRVSFVEDPSTGAETVTTQHDNFSFSCN
jgi:hypothetical protein